MTLPNSKKELGHDHAHHIPQMKSYSGLFYDQNVFHVDLVNVMHIPSLPQHIENRIFTSAVTCISSLSTALRLPLSSAFLVGRAGRPPYSVSPLNVEQHEFMGLSGSDQCLPIAKSTV